MTALQQSWREGLASAWWTVTETDMSDGERKRIQDRIRTASLREGQQSPDLEQARAMRDVCLDVIAIALSLAKHLND